MSTRDIIGFSEWRQKRRQLFIGGAWLFQKSLHVLSLRKQARKQAFLIGWLLEYSVSLVIRYLCVSTN